MKRGSLICSLIVLCGIRVLADFQSPRDLAVHLEDKLASFAGLGMPDTNAPCLFFIGVLPLPDCATTNGTGFLPSFTNGLVSVLEYDIETFPVAIRVENDNDGITVFRNSDNIAFHWEFPTLSPYYSDWIVQLFGRDPSTLSTLTLEMLRPSHVGGQAIFVAEENLQAYNEARLAAPPPQSGTPFPPDRPVINFTRINILTNAISFASEWNSVAYFPTPSRMNLFWKPRLDSSAWTLIHTLPVSTLQQYAVFDLPWTMIPPEPFVHDPQCVPVEIYMPSPLAPESVIYTNTICDCIIPLQETSRGFFKLGIRDNGFLPAWWRILYGFSPYDSWEDYVDFSNTGDANWEKFEQSPLNNPIAPPNSSLPNTAIQYHYDSDDRLMTTFIGVDGDATIRHLTPAGNPNIQQERSAP